MDRSIERFMPLAGVAFVVLLVVGLALGGAQPSLDASTSEVVDFFTDNGTQLRISSLILAVALFALLLFVGKLASAMRDENSSSVLSSTVIGGGVVAATGLAADAALRFGMVNSAGEISPEALQGVFAVWSGYFLAVHIGFAIFILAATLAALPAKSAPVWLAGLGIIAPLLLIIPVSEIALIGLIPAGIWVIATSVRLYRESPAQ